MEDSILKSLLEVSDRNPSTDLNDFRRTLGIIDSIQQIALKRAIIHLDDEKVICQKQNGENEFILKGRLNLTDLTKPVNNSSDFVYFMKNYFPNFLLGIKALRDGGKRSTLWYILRELHPHLSTEPSAIYFENEKFTLSYNTIYTRYNVSISTNVNTRYKDSYISTIHVMDHKLMEMAMKERAGEQVYPNLGTVVEKSYRIPKSKYVAEINKVVKYALEEYKTLLSEDLAESYKRTGLSTWEN